MSKIIKAIHRLQWRVRYTFIGSHKIPSMGIAMWWDWSATDYAEFGDMSTPRESVQEEIYAMAASQ
jgi:hypothetical protein